MICPLVEPSDSADELEDVPGIARDDEGRVTVPVPLHDTATELDRLRLALPGLTVERLHGRMPAGEKDRVIAAFKRGEIDVLVSTTVVEVCLTPPSWSSRTASALDWLPCTSCAAAWAVAVCRARAWS